MFENSVCEVETDLESNTYRIDHCVAGCMTRYLPRENYLPRKPRNYEGEARDTSEASKGDNFSQGR